MKRTEAPFQAAALYMYIDCFEFKSVCDIKSTNKFDFISL